ncbi:MULTISPECIES: hypothetical protein [Sorangium]|nr:MULTISPECIES: hypothetical protein [Sorangium]
MPARSQRAGHRHGAQGPPQSTPVSPAFITRSVGEGADAPAYAG